MTNPATLILKTTRSGKRDPVHRLNQPVCWDKLEPNRRRHHLLVMLRKGEPGPNGTRLDRVVELEASPLLVILHYLLKNNTEFMMGYGAGQDVPPTPQRCHFMGGHLR
jgi:hypothetical protein